MHYSMFPLCPGCCEMHWICPTCPLVRLILKPLKGNLMPAPTCYPLLINDNVTLRGERVFMCQCETDVVRESHRSLALSAQCSQTRVRLVQWALWRYITRSFSDNRLAFLFSDSNTVRLPLTYKGKGQTENTERSTEITVPLELTYQGIKHLEPISLRAFIQNTKESVQGVL